ncbi:MAG: hypothetical protein CL891_05195 [Dehalococcoidia bacterium]|nr:hypothetical protein [Dehalococcoidia bacterium]
MSRIRRVMLVQPRSPGGNFEYVVIPRQGLLFLSGALQQSKGRYLYERELHFEDRSGQLDVEKDLDGVDVLMISALINEAPRAYEIGRLAKQNYPNIISIGGGPHMTPLAKEAIREGKFDVIVLREGEDIIAQLTDVLLTYKDADLIKELHKIPGIAFMEGNHLVETSRRGLISPDFVSLPDFYSIRDLTPSKPLMGGVLETVRGCTEKCTYCQVIQQFLGYRMISRETELARLTQLQKMAEDGLISTNRENRFSVFVSDDLHPPPLRAVKFRNERLERIKNWKGYTDDMYLICQSRAEIGQDPELSEALRDINMEMLYVGVESDDAKNLEYVKKRQEPGQVFKDLVSLNNMGFSVVAMTIIGLPHDTEKSIMEMAARITSVSKYQTANWLTPLPATSNWDDLVPLNGNGEILKKDEMRPYHLYTGRQFVHHDERWSMEESRNLFDLYQSKLNPVDTLYSRLFRIAERYRKMSNTTDPSAGKEVSYKNQNLGDAKKIVASDLLKKGVEITYEESSLTKSLGHTNTTRINLLPKI